jgi:hypothetical protein
LAVEVDAGVVKLVFAVFESGVEYQEGCPVGFGLRDVEQMLDFMLLDEAIKIEDHRVERHDVDGVVVGAIMEGYLSGVCVPIQTGYELCKDAMAREVLPDLPEAEEEHAGREQDGKDRHSWVFVTLSCQRRLG